MSKRKDKVLRLRYREICDEEMAGHYNSIIYDDEEDKTKKSVNLTNNFDSESIIL